LGCASPAFPEFTRQQLEKIDKFRELARKQRSAVPVTEKVPIHLTENPLLACMLIQFVMWLDREKPKHPLKSRATAFAPSFFRASGFTKQTSDGNLVLSRIDVDLKQSYDDMSQESKAKYEKWALLPAVRRVVDAAKQEAYLIDPPERAINFFGQYLKNNKIDFNGKYLGLS
jgi:hypothetical protein